MIRAFVDYSLGNKLLVLAVAAILIGWGAIAFAAGLLALAATTATNTRTRIAARGRD